jgi:hypothetical protein
LRGGSDADYVGVADSPTREAMPSVNVRSTTAGLLIALAASAIGCARLPPVQPAPVAQAPLGVFVDPNVSVEIVQDERGKDLVPLLRDAFAKELVDAGYHVVTDGPADVTLHVDLAKVGYAKYGTGSQPWVQGITLNVSGGGQLLAHVDRATVNWSDYEGANTAERIKFTARVLVNAMSRNKRVVRYAEMHPAAAPVVTSGTPAPSSPAPTSASPAPAASVTTPGYAPATTPGYAPVAPPASAPASAPAPVPAPQP